MSARARSVALGLAWGLAACDEGGRVEAAGPPPIEVDLPPAGEPAYVDLRLEPRETTYARGDAPRVSAVVYDREDAPLADLRPRLRVEPPGAATLGLEGQLSFAAEGPGAVYGCAGPDGPNEVCGVAHFYVDDGPPTLTVEVPSRGARVVGAPRILVAGAVEDGGIVDVFVNDVPATVEAGRFRVELPARFGLNRVEVVATDGLHEPARDIREILWSPQLLAVEGDEVHLDDALILRVDQATLDADAETPVPDEDGLRVTPDIAGLIEAILLQADPLRAFDAELNAGGVSARLEAARLTDIELEVALDADGIDLFVRGLLDLDTEGRFAFEGAEVDLGGTLAAQVAVRGRLDVFVPGEGAAEVLLDGVAVAIEGIGGNLRDGRAQALLDTLGSTLRGALEGYAQDLARDLVQVQVRAALQSLVTEGLATLAELRLPAPAPALQVGFTLTDPTLRRRADLTLALSGEIRHGSPPDPPYASRGVPWDESLGPPPWPGRGGLGVAVRLVALNAALHELWRARALALDLAEVPGLPGLRVRVDGRLPPVLVPGEPGGAFPLVLQIGELGLELSRERPAMRATYTLSARAGIGLETSGGALTLALADRPDVRVALETAEGAALPAEALTTLVDTLVWSQVKAAVGPGLSLPLTDIAIGPEALVSVAPTLREVALRPSFPQEAVVQDGWLVLGADLRGEVR